MKLKKNILDENRSLLGSKLSELNIKEKALVNQIKDVRTYLLTKIDARFKELKSDVIKAVHTKRKTIEGRKDILNRYYLQADYALAFSDYILQQSSQSDEDSFALLSSKQTIDKQIRRIKKLDPSSGLVDETSTWKLDLYFQQYSGQQLHSSLESVLKQVMSDVKVLDTPPSHPSSAKQTPTIELDADSSSIDMDISTSDAHGRMKVQQCQTTPSPTAMQANAPRMRGIMRGGSPVRGMRLQTPVIRNGVPTSSFKPGGMAPLTRGALSPRMMRSRGGITRGAIAARGIVTSPVSSSVRGRGASPMPNVRGASLTPRGRGVPIRGINNPNVSAAKIRGAQFSRGRPRGITPVPSSRGRGTAAQDLAKRGKVMTGLPPGNVIQVTIQANAISSPKSVNMGQQMQTNTAVVDGSVSQQAQNNTVAGGRGHQALTNTPQTQQQVLLLNTIVPHQQHQPQILNPQCNQQQQQNPYNNPYHAAAYGQPLQAQQQSYSNPIQQPVLQNQPGQNHPEQHCKPIPEKPTPNLVNNSAENGQQIPIQQFLSQTLQSPQQSNPGVSVGREGGGLAGLAWHTSPAKTSPGKERGAADNSFKITIPSLKTMAPQNDGNIGQRRSSSPEIIHLDEEPTLLSPLSTLTNLLSNSSRSSSETIPNIKGTEHLEANAEDSSKSEKTFGESSVRQDETNSSSRGTSSEEAHVTSSDAHLHKTPVNSEITTETVANSSEEQPHSPSSISRSCQEEEIEGSNDDVSKPIADKSRGKNEQPDLFSLMDDTNDSGSPADWMPTTVSLLTRIYFTHCCKSI